MCIFLIEKVMIKICFYFDRVKRYLGPVQLHFIKDFWAVRGEGIKRILN
jgi:hypothetical protein